MNMFFIDADNLSSAVWIEEGCQALETKFGPLSVRRAYGSPENLRLLSEVLKTRAIRAFQNLSLNKNTTDMALAVDAMEFACHPEKPTCIAIGSGDADFLPLVVRLRERGIRIVCVSLQGKMAAEAVYAYDEIIFISEASTTSVCASEKTEVTLGSAPVMVTDPKTPSKKVASKKSASLPKKLTSEEPSITAVTKALPELKTGKWLHLGDAVKALREAKLLSKNGSSSKFFDKFGSRFELSPEAQPHKVRMLLVAFEGKP